MTASPAADLAARASAGVLTQAMIIDVRPDQQFRAGHVIGAYGIPLEELRDRTHELPSNRTDLEVHDADPGRASQAATFLRLRGHPVSIGEWDARTCLESGPARVHPWQPAAFLVEALSVIGPSHPAFAPSRPRALDIACGSGRDAVFLALQGYEVDAIDVLPDALARARDLGARNGVHLNTIARDLERDPALSEGGYNVITVFRYLQRNLFPAIRDAMLPGGYIVYETFHERTRQTGCRPNNPAHLLQTGELVSHFPDFDVLIARDAIERDGRFFSSLLARRPATSFTQHVCECR